MLAWDRKGSSKPDLFLQQLRSKERNCPCGISPGDPYSSEEKILSFAEKGDLNRTLAKLRADGLLAVKDHHVELIERQALELLGHFERLSLMRVPSGRS